MGSKQSNWGGSREGAGAKSTWLTGGAGTKLIRVPVAIEKLILDAARRLDKGEVWKASESVTQSSDEMKVEISHLNQRLNAREEMVAVQEKRIKVLQQENEQLLKQNQELKSQSELVTESKTQLQHYKNAYHGLLDDQESTCAKLKGGVVDILRNAEQKLKGYESKNFSQGLKHLKGLYDRCI